MNTFWLDESSDAEAVSTASDDSRGLLTVGECLQHSIDRKLGYFGRERFAFFYYEPRGGEVVWNDGRSYGFGSGGWLTFEDEIAPLGPRYGVDLGSCEKAGKHVLLIDRGQRLAYFADRRKAEAMVAKQHGVAIRQLKHAC